MRGCGWAILFIFVQNKRYAQNRGFRRRPSWQDPFAPASAIRTLRTCRFLRRESRERCQDREGI